MHELVDAGFAGIFTEVDFRDRSRVDLNNLSELPSIFFEKYLNFLRGGSPKLAATIGSPTNLKILLNKQSTAEEGLLARQVEVNWQGTRYSNYPYVSTSGKLSAHPTGVEFGEFLFSDAMAATKLHMIAKLMADGHIEGGPIIDFCGSSHIDSRAFFLNFPQYAMEIVLRHPHLVMAGRVKDIEEVYKLFDVPDWSEITREILRLVFKKVEPRRDR